ncbi:MAG: 2,5-diamino-6-(ribosylamino)-4(3H)-pyrimidinone 5'-phosphate reductase [Candidatus Hodarchaeota archaeon]
MKNVKKPYIMLSTAMTIDGKISSKNGDSEISDEEDWKEVHKIRTQVDAIMVGKNTILRNNPKLHIKFYQHTGYYRIVIDSNLSIPIDSQIINFKPEMYPTIICTTENVTEDKINRFRTKNVKIIKSGTGNQVDIKLLMEKLYNFGIRSILLEGGGNLNWSFLKEDLVDEIRIFVAPWIVGGKNAISFVEGDGFNKMIEAPRFRLIKVRQRENYVILKYKRK